MTDRDSAQAKAKAIYAYLTKNGCSPTCAVAVMCNLYRKALGIVFPINRLCVDYGGDSGYPCLACGGLRAYVYPTACNVCNKYGLSGAKKTLGEMQKYALQLYSKYGKSVRLSDLGRQEMMKKFPQGFPIPFEVQMKDVISQVNSKLGKMKTWNYNGAKIATEFHRHNNSKTKIGGEWEKAPEICRLIGIDFNSLNKQAPTNNKMGARQMRKESLIREFRENYFNLYGRMQRLDETAGGNDPEEEEFMDNEFNYDRMDDMERDWNDWEDNREDGNDGIDFLDDDEDTTRTGLHRRSGRDDDHFNRPFKRYEDENMNIFDDPAGMASEDDYQHFHHPDGYLSMLAQDPSERGDVAREFKGTRGSEGDGMRRAHHWPVDED